MYVYICVYEIEYNIKYDWLRLINVKSLIRALLSSDKNTWIGKLKLEKKEKVLT